MRKHTSSKVSGQHSWSKKQLDQKKKRRKGAIYRRVATIVLIEKKKTHVKVQEHPNGVVSLPQNPLHEGGGDGGGSGGAGGDGGDGGGAEQIGGLPGKDPLLGGMHESGLFSSFLRMHAYTT